MLTERQIGITMLYEEIYTYASERILSQCDVDSNCRADKHQMETMEESAQSHKLSYGGRINKRIYGMRKINRRVATTYGKTKEQGKRQIFFSRSTGTLFSVGVMAEFGEISLVSWYDWSGGIHRIHRTSQLNVVPETVPMQLCLRSREMKMALTISLLTLN